MRHILTLLFAALCCMPAYSQFGGLLDKVKNKVANKIMGQQAKKDSTASNPNNNSINSNPGNNTNGNSPANSSSTNQDAASGNNNSGTNSGFGKHTAPQPPEFVKTGKIVKATTATFGIDTENDWNALLKNPIVQEYISRLRQKGLTGSDKSVLTQGMKDQEAYADIESDMRAKYGNVKNTLKPGPALTFAAFMSNYDYIMTNDFIRAEISTRDTANGPSLAATMMQAFAPGSVTIVDVRAKKMYAVANYMGILSAAVGDDISSFQDAFGLAAYFKKYMQAPGLKLQSIGSSTFHGYHASAVRLEIPVTPTTDEDGQKSDQLLYLHSMLSGTFTDLVGGKYDPTYKLYLETYYSHDLDGKIPPAITGDKNILHVDGFYIGSVLKDEKGNQVSYSIKGIDPNTMIDEGMFIIPASCEKMTHTQFKQKIQDKLHGR